MEPALLISLAVIVIIFASLVFFLSRTTSDGNAQGNEVNDGVERRPVPVEREGPRRAARRPRRRVHVQDEDSDAEDEPELERPEYDDSGKKIGKKKQEKLLAKEEKRQARVAAEREREERKEREEQRAALRKKEEERLEAEEKAKEEEEKRKKEEEAKRQHEEYLLLKESFVVEDEGMEESADPETMESMLNTFIDYIKKNKVVMLEDLASEFKMKVQDAIDRVKTLQENGRLPGVMDDRGKFIHITMEEYEAVAKFIRQRGRVSITELAESSNKLINLNPDTSQTDDLGVAA